MIRLDNAALIQTNAALSAAKANEELNRRVYRGSYASYMPSVSLSYSHAWRENNTLALDEYSPKTLMVFFSMPLFSGFQNYASTRSAYYDYRRTQEEFTDQLQNTRFILTETANRLVNLKTQKGLSKATVEFSEQNYRVVEKQKERGVASNIEFIDAKLSLQNAKLNEITVHYDFISAMVELYYLLGKLGSVVDY
jgi:outer membrane protein TolC